MKCKLYIIYKYYLHQFNNTVPVGIFLVQGNLSKVFFLFGRWRFIFQERVKIILTDLSMSIYISREGGEPINQLNHGNRYIKRGLGSL